MVEECPKCGSRYAKYPIKDENGKWIPKNFFKMDFMSIAFLVVILFLLFAYQHDTQDCREDRENPCNVCVQSNCCQAIVTGEYVSTDDFQLPNDIGID